MKRIHILLIALFSVAIGSCVKEGCTDIEADNYDADANTENLSCAYSGNVVFWCTKPVSDSLYNEGHVMLRFELEGVLVDSIATASFFSTSGGCNTGGTKTILREFSGNTTRKYKYRVKGLGFNTIYEDYIEIKANDCIDVQLF